ncbi:2Fe-2S iron-sulfur cluster-binding protein [Streptomyces ipomoeae]|uniref:2Fe-2S iron-sulfur cluster-binding protein n=1 Tax=Streptomyces ipomoeae TaxID=103232 RepID=UPI0038D42FAF
MGFGEVADGGFEVVLARSAHTVTVTPGESILDALEARGVDAPWMCRSGICGTCETAVIEGDPDHRDNVLSDAERAAGRSIMLCVSRSLSGRLVLDL